MIGDKVSLPFASQESVDDRRNSQSSFSARVYSLQLPGPGTTMGAGVPFLLEPDATTSASILSAMWHARPEH